MAKCAFNIYLPSVRVSPFTGSSPYIQWLDCFVFMLVFLRGGRVVGHWKTEILEV